MQRASITLTVAALLTGILACTLGQSHPLPTSPGPASSPQGATTAPTLIQPSVVLPPSVDVLF